MWKVCSGSFGVSSETCLRMARQNPQTAGLGEVCLDAAIKLQTANLWIVKRAEDLQKRSRYCLMLACITDNATNFPHRGVLEHLSAKAPSS